jgi:hypothetical protein
MSPVCSPPAVLVVDDDEGVRGVVRVLIVTGCAEIPDNCQISCDSMLSKPISASLLFSELERMSTNAEAVSP